jgi:predicted RNase H-like nuclease (RuvC/YqgF family)
MTEDLARRIADLEATVRALKAEVTRLSRELESMGAEARRLSSDMLPFRRIGPLPGHPERDAMEKLKRFFEGRGEHLGGSP